MRMEDSPSRADSNIRKALLKRINRVDCLGMAGTAAKLTFVETQRFCAEEGAGVRLDRGGV